MTLSALDPRTALIIIDLQKGFVSCPLIDLASEVVNHARDRAEAFRSEGLLLGGHEFGVFHADAGMAKRIDRELRDLDGLLSPRRSAPFQPHDLLALLRPNVPDASSPPVLLYLTAVARR
jgi:nicotinamidase-related amidase